jgi:hypothetical protein
LVDVAHDQQSGTVRHRLQQRLHQHDIDHRGLIDNQQVAVERIVLAALEAAPLWIDLKQSVDGLGLKTGRLGHKSGAQPTLQDGKASCSGASGIVGICMRR